MRTYQEIQTEIEYFEGELKKLRKEAEEAKAVEVEEARKRVAQIMKDAGLTADAFLKNTNAIDKDKLLSAKSPGTRPRKQPEPQYQDPVTGKTWTGQGRSPRWLEGKDREEFRIKKAA